MHTPRSQISKNLSDGYTLWVPVAVNGRVENIIMIPNKTLEKGARDKLEVVTTEESKDFVEIVNDYTINLCNRIAPMLIKDSDIVNLKDEGIVEEPFELTWDDSDLKVSSQRLDVNKDAEEEVISIGRQLTPSAWLLDSKEEER